MPARDIYHLICKNALIKDGWTITHDPLKLQWGKKDLYVDLGAEKLIAAEKENHQIAVEVKNFVGRSNIDDLEKALGQYILYHDILSRKEPESALYLAIHDDIFTDLFEEPIGQLLIENYRLQLIVFNSITEVITKWIT